MRFILDHILLPRHSPRHLQLILDLDPMFSHKEKSALVKQEMRQWLELFHAQADSGLTATEFWRRHEVWLGSFFQRRRSLGWQGGGVGDWAREKSLYYA